MQPVDNLKKGVKMTTLDIAQVCFLIIVVIVGVGGMIKVLFFDKTK